MEDSKAIMPYWLLLKDLNSEAKWALVELLIGSLRGKNGATKNEEPNKLNWADEFAGDWNDWPESAEEIIEMIEGSRTMGREIEAI